MRGASPWPLPIPRSTTEAPSPDEYKLKEEVISYLLALALCVSPAHAQTKQRRTAPSKPVPTPSQAPANRWPIESLAVQGNANYPSERILAVAGLKKGQVAGKDEFEAARDRLLATGMFESVGYRFEPSPGGKGFAASFQVVEVLPAYPIAFEDLPVAADAIRHFLVQTDPLFQTKIPATKQILDRYVRAVEEFLAKQGKPEKVAARLRADAPEQFVIVFRPAAMPPSVAEVRFTGNSVIPLGTLQSAVHGAAIGSVFNEARFRQTLDLSIRPLYEARGRIRVAFPSIQTERANDVNGIAVNVQVREGESYDLGDVRIEGVPNTEQLLKAAAFHKGDIANFDEIKAGIARMEQALKRNGYLRVKTHTERHIDDAKKIVDLTIPIDPGPQFVFGKLNIQGLDILSEPAIRKMWALKEGKPFNVEYPDYFLSRVREEGVFDNLGDTASKIQVNDAGRTVEVTLVFKGQERPKKPAIP